MEAVFIHVPRSGGTSLVKVLEDNMTVLKSVRSLKEFALGSEPSKAVLSLDHINPDLLLKAGLISPSHFKRISFFGVKRDLENRIVSAFKFYKVRFPNLSAKRFIALLMRNNYSNSFRNVFGLSLAEELQVFLPSASVALLDYEVLNEEWQSFAYQNSGVRFASRFELPSLRQDAALPPEEENFIRKALKFDKRGA